MVYPKDEPLTAEQTELLHRIVYNENRFIGLRRLFPFVLAEVEKTGTKRIYRDQLERWMKEQEVFQIHHQPPKRKDTRQVTSQVKGVLDMVQADLVVFGDNDLDKTRSYRYPYKFILNVIDIYSRYLWSRPLANNRSDTVTTAIMDIFKEAGRQPKVLVTDQGAEFNGTYGTTKHLKGKAGNPYGQAVVERVNQTIKKTIFKAMSASGKKDWSVMLPSIVETYNNAPHKGVGGLTPLAVFKGAQLPEKAESIMKQKAKAESDIPLESGSQVRIRQNLKGSTLKKGQATYSTDVYNVKGVKKPRANTTLLHTYQLENVKGSFNRTELLPVQGVQKVAPKPTEIKSASVEPVPDLRRSARLNEKRAILPRMD